MTVVYPHALPLDERMWPNGAHAPRLYGPGRTMDDWAEGVLAAYPGRLVLVGASMGGYCALALARRAPELVVGMVLVASRATADSFDRMRERDNMVGVLRSKGVPPDLETEEPAELLAVAQEAMRNRMDLSAVAASFGGPLLVCVGDHDGVVSVEESRELAESALRGTLEVFLGAGHFPSIEQAERFNEILVEFVSQWQT